MTTMTRTDLGQAGVSEATEDAEALEKVRHAADTELLRREGAAGDCDRGDANQCSIPCRLFLPLPDALGLDYCNASAPAA